MKAYKDENGKIRLFRPDMNMARMNRSTARIALPVSFVYFYFYFLFFFSRFLPHYKYLNFLLCVAIQWR